MTRKLAVVDAFSAGRYVAPEFRARGWQCVHVQSRERPLEAIAGTFVADDFSARLVHDRDTESLASDLQRHGVQAVVPGCEMAVPLTDALNAHLGLRWNSLATSALRRDKYLMLEAVRARRLRAPTQIRVSAGADLHSWLRERTRDEYPIVVKPVNSAGSDGVAFCDTMDGVAAAVERLLGRMNLMGFPNDQVLMQGFLRGAEWTVNTVSWNGRHRVTDLWRVHKQRVAGAGFIYDRSELMPGTGKEQSDLVEYVCEALDAIGIQYGPAHTEVMLTADGPVLIEVGARPQGAIDPAAPLHGVGTNQFIELANALEAPESFAVEGPNGGGLRTHVLLVRLINRCDGIVTGLPLEDPVKRLPTLFGSPHLSVHVGSRVRRTVDLFSSPGYVYLAGSREDVFRDYRTCANSRKGESRQAAAWRPVIRATPSDDSPVAPATWRARRRTGCLQEGVESYAKVKHVLRRR